MASRAYSTLVGLITPHVTGCPTPTIIAAVRQAAEELCRKAGVWRVDLTPIDVVALTYSYPLVTGDADSQVVTPLVVSYDGAELPDVRTLDLRRGVPSHPDTSKPSTPVAYMHKALRVLELYPVPEVSVTAGLKVHAKLEPTKASTGIDTDVFNENEETLVHGTLYRLMVQPKKDWTDIKLADFHARKFRANVYAAKARMELGQVYRTLTVEIPRIA